MVKTNKRNIKLNTKLNFFYENIDLLKKCEGLIGQLKIEKVALLVKVSEVELSRQLLLKKNEKLKVNLSSMGKDNESLNSKV